MSSHITQLSEKTGAKVNMVSSVDEITNKAAKAAIEEGRKITGWYDEKTGEVHLYMPKYPDRLYCREDYLGMRWLDTRE